MNAPAGERPFFTKGNGWVIAALLLTALCVYLWQEYNQNNENVLYAKITINGQETESFPLNSDKVFSLDSLPQVVFEIKDGAAAFIKSNCPDKICIHSGFMQSAGEMAVCLPNRVSLLVVSADGR